MRRLGAAQSPPAKRPEVAWPGQDRPATLWPAGHWRDGVWPRNL